MKNQASKPALLLMRTTWALLLAVVFSSSAYAQMAGLSTEDERLLWHEVTKEVDRIASAIRAYYRLHDRWPGDLKDLAGSASRQASDTDNLGTGLIVGDFDGSLVDTLVFAYEVLPAHLSLGQLEHWNGVVRVARPMPEQSSGVAYVVGVTSGLVSRNGSPPVRIADEAIVAEFVLSIECGVIVPE